MTDIIKTVNKTQLSNGEIRYYEDTQAREDITNVKATFNKLSVDLDAKQDKLIAGDNITIEDNIISSHSNTDYNQLENKPTLNGKTIEGDLEFKDFELKTSDLINDEGFLNKDNVKGEDGIVIEETSEGITIHNTQTSAEWGKITGDISDQHDLQAKFNTKQDTLTAGNRINIANNTISFQDYTAGTGINITNDAISANTETLATKTYVDNELTTKQDILTPGSGIRISKEGNDTVIETVASAPTWGSIEGTLSNQTDLNSILTGLRTDVDNKQDELIQGSNITIDGNTISAIDTKYTAGNGLNLTGTEFSIDTSVTATKESVDAKQDTISDLAAIRSGANLGSTSIQPNDNITELTNNAGYISEVSWGDITGTLSSQVDLNNALSAKQDTISDLATIRTNANKAATALQPNDNISELTNDAGYITSLALPTKTSDLTNDGNGDLDSLGQAIPFITSDVTDNITKRIDDIITTGGEPNKIDSIKKNGTELPIVDKTVNIEVPTKVSDLTNDSGFITSSYHDSTKQDVISDLETIRSNASTAVQPGDNVSDLTNDAGYITIASVPTSTSQLTNNGENGTDKFATESQVTTLSDRVDDLEEAGGEPNVITKIQQNGSDLPIVNKTVNVTVPTKLSDLTDDSDFITSTELATELSDMATKTWVGNQNYLTDSDIAGKADTSYVNTELGKKQDKLTSVNAGSGIEITTDQSGKVTISNTNVSAEWGNIQGTLSDQNDLQDALDDKVDKVTGMGLSQNSYTTTEKDKLAGIDSGAQVNVIESISKNGTALTISNKNVDIVVPTKTSDLTNDGNGATPSDPFATESDVNTVDTKLTNLETRVDDIIVHGGEPNTINHIQKNGVELPITNKTVNVTVPTKVSDLTNDTGFGTITEVTAGSGLTGGGTTGSISLGHSNSITAQTTSGLYPIKIDAQGHITEYGEALDLHEMVILRYGVSKWSDFIDAYRHNAIVYCRASSNSNPASGSQTRMAFMAYVNNADNPTNVEFQYYRSVSSHTFALQGDEVYVYKLENNNNWSVTARKAYSKVDTENGLAYTFSGGTSSVVKLKANLQSETKLSNDSVAATEVSGRVYPVALDKSGYLAVNVPWTDSVNDVKVNGTSILSSGVADLITNTAYDSTDNKIATMSDVSSMGTVKSVQVAATGPIQSSQDTSQTETLSTTISLADAYGDTKNPYGSKTKNFVLAAPSNANGTPSFRALTTADIPNITVSKISDFPSIPSKTSDLVNDSDFVSDASYVHTDNNFTTTLKNKLDGIAAGAEVNVQVDWNETDSTSDAFIKNKPSIPTKTSDLTNDSGFATETYVQNYHDSTKQDKLTAGNGIVFTGNTISTDISYTDVSNKPSINGVTLSGNKTASDLGIVSGTVVRLIRWE